MITLILIGWILYQLSAPVWCWVLFSIAVILKLILLGIKIGEAAS